MQVTVIEEVALTAGCSRFDARFVLATEALSTTATAAGHSEASSHRHWITRRPPDGAAGSCAGIFGVLPPGGVRGGAPPGRPMGAGFLTDGQGPAERRSGLPLGPRGPARPAGCRPEVGLPPADRPTDSAEEPKIPIAAHLRTTLTFSAIDTNGPDLKQIDGSISAEPGGVG